MEYAEVFLRLLTVVLHHGKHYKAFVEQMIKTVMNGHMFRSTSEQSLVVIISNCHYSGNQFDRFYTNDWKHFFSAQIVRNFCRAVISQVRKSYNIIAGN